MTAEKVMKEKTVRTILALCRRRQVTDFIIIKYRITTERIVRFSSISRLRYILAAGDFTRSFVP